MLNAASMDEKPKRNKHAILPPVIGAFLIVLSLTGGVFVSQFTIYRST